MLPQAISRCVHNTADVKSTSVPPSGLVTDDKFANKEGDEFEIDTVAQAANDADDREPTEEESSLLRKVPAHIPFLALSVLLIEFAERASYYGSRGPFNNFLNRGLPKGGNGAGAVAKGAAGKNQKPGALALGSVKTSAVVEMFTFLVYVTPIFGAIVSDTKWGRFKSIWIGAVVGAIAHVLLIIPAIPQVIQHPNGSLGAFLVAILILAFASGLIKPGVAPLLCDQSPVRVPTLKKLASGESVIVDPAITIERYMIVFYWCINVGAFFALATSYSARFVGFWLAFLLPGIIYMIMPIVLVFTGKHLYKAPPQGSVVIEAFSVFKTCFRNGGWKRLGKGDRFWEVAKPSFIQERDGYLDLDIVFWDDRFVDEIKQTMRACAVFALIPIYTLSDGGTGNAANSMSAGMTLNGVPNDLLSNFNSLTIIVVAPVLNYVVYPYLTKVGHPLKPMTRMCLGFLLGSLSNVCAALVQWRIYETSPCGWHASTCAQVSPVSLWWQLPIYVFPAIAQLFVNVTSYELAYTRSPARMKGLVYSLALFNNAVSSAISLAIADAVQDPYLIWVWTAIACATFVTAWVFPTYFRHLNEPVSGFAAKERMEGNEQPKVLAKVQRERA